MIREAIVCLDIGGTNCRIGLVGRDGTLSEGKIIPTCELAREDFIAALAAMIGDFCRCASGHTKIRAVSMGFPATIDRDRRRVLQVPNIPGIADNLPICDTLEKALGLPVFLERDVNLLLAYDLKELNLEQADTVIGVYFGTGIGNSIYINGKWLRGYNGVAGELGHIPQIHSHVQCGCSNCGCVEPLGGGRRLSELCQTKFIGTDIKEIYLRHGDTPEVCSQVEAMAVAVATEVNILDPDYVVLGGGLLQMEGFPKEYFEEKIREHTRKPYPLQNLRLRYARMNQENGIIGAGLYGWRCLEG